MCIWLVIIGHVFCRSRRDGFYQETVPSRRGSSSRGWRRQIMCIWLVIIGHVFCRSRRDGFYQETVPNRRWSSSRGWTRIRTRQIVRYRATITLRRLQIKQYTAYKVNLIGYYRPRVLPESPRWLLSRYRTEKAWVVIKRVAKANKVNLIGYYRPRVLPESPRWLLSRNRTEQAWVIIKRVAKANKVYKCIWLVISSHVSYRSRQDGFYQETVPNRRGSSSRGWRLNTKYYTVLITAHVFYQSRRGGFYQETVSSRRGSSSRGWRRQVKWFDLLLQATCSTGVAEMASIKKPYRTGVGHHQEGG